MSLLVRVIVGVEALTPVRAVTLSFAAGATSIAETPVATDTSPVLPEAILIVGCAVTLTPVRTFAVVGVPRPVIAAAVPFPATAADFVRTAFFDLLPSHKYNRCDLRLS